MFLVTGYQKKNNFILVLILYDIKLNLGTANLFYFALIVL